MISPIKNRRAAGFSLIEVMVAIVILSIGLLALASLQLTLMRNSSETKAQSTALALAKGRLEELAAYDTMATYRGITDGTMTIANPVGGVTYTGNTIVERYVYDKAAAGATKYVQVADTLSDAAVKAIDADYLPGREFKRVVAIVQWDDSSGIRQQVRVEDAISAIDPSDTIAVNKFSDFGEARKAQAIITNPASVAGVIPIAVGNGTDTAATNPRPILLSQGSSTTLVETRFDIYTYAALSGSTAQAQSRVETSVVGCTCRTGTGTATSFRPTYWNGFEYTSPDTSALARASTPKTGIDQSTLCTACCRDHQDPSTVTGQKFDPRRSPHNHYLASDLNTPLNLESVAANTDYNDACRLIRIDGVFRVAAEPYNDAFGLVATAGLNQSGPSDTVAEAVPGTTSTANYQTFVLNYLHARFITGAQANYNTPIDASAVTGASALDLPATAAIATASSPQYLHARGLFVDYLTDEVRQMVRDAGLSANCLGTDNQPADSDDEFRACVFKLLPFTSINLSEIAAWTATQPTKIEIVNNDFKDTIDSQFPVKGQAVLKSGAGSGDTSMGQATIQRTSAGLAVTQKVFPDGELSQTYAPNMLTDPNNQTFQVGTVVSTPSNDKVHVVLEGSQMLAGVAYGAGNAPQVGFTLSNSSCNTDENTGGDGTAANDMDGDTGNDDVSKPDEFRCIPDSGQTMGGSVDVTVSNYNRIIAGGVTVANSCRNSGETTSMPYSKDYDVTAVDLLTVATAGVDANSDGDYLDVGDTAPTYTISSLGTGNVTNLDQPGILAVNGEYTAVNVNPLNNLARIRFTFGNFVYRCPANWATFITNGGAWMNLNNPTKTASCSQGNGNSASNVPLWSTTYSTCPTGFSPFQ